jgi:hypothetical protein
MYVEIRMNASGASLPRGVILMSRSVHVGPSGREASSVSLIAGAWGE